MATVITPPTSEPITIDEARLHLRVDHCDEDELINTLITAAREQAEHIIGRAIMPQTLELELSSFSGDITLEHPPIVSVESIKYLDATVAEITLLAGDYVLTNGYIKPVTAWPSGSAVKVRYVAGYADAESVPAGIKAWIKLAIGTWYAKREGMTADEKAQTLPHGFYDGLLDRYRLWRL